MADLSSGTVTVGQHTFTLTAQPMGTGFILSVTGTSVNGEKAVEFKNIGKQQTRLSVPFFEFDAPKKTPDPSLAKSKINRAGLKAGAVAPEFRLPHIGGDEVSLSDYRGQKVLLVFSDPNCGPCDLIAPKLQEVHLNRPDLQVLVISRRDAAAVRAKADKHGTTYPIVMQKQWEISKDYGMFATPIGYLIGPDGVLLSDVAVGADKILALVKQD